MTVRHRRLRWHCLQVGLLALAVQAAPAASWRAEASDPSDLAAGFRLLYELKPADARVKFAAWRASHPDDPIASAADAASYLFEECSRQGVLTSEYFLDDERFLGENAIKPDPELRDAFFAAVRRAQDLARRRLVIDSENANALFALTLSLGMQADYASLIDKHQLESLGMIREANTFATRLLTVNPDAADAFLTLGTANYVVGSLPALKRFLLRFKGISGSKDVGLQQLEIAAARGRYLRPFAKVLLGLAALRERKPALARIQLQELVAEFPNNPLFASELAKLEAGATPGDGIDQGFAAASSWASCCRIFAERFRWASVAAGSDSTSP